MKGFTVVSNVFSSVFLCVLCVEKSAAAAAETQTITVREQLNQTYGPELVSYPFTAPEGGCVADSVRLVGPEGPVAAQLTDIEYGEKKFVKKARLYFVVPGLKPLSSVSYTLSFGKERAKDAVATDLQVKREGKQVEITTGKFGVRLRVDDDPYVPIPVQEAPGPLVGMRLGDGNWAGSSLLTGMWKLAGFMGALSENGPVLARVSFFYAFLDRDLAELRATVVAGDNGVRWKMAVVNERPGWDIIFRFPPVPGVKQAVTLQGYGQWSRADRTAPLTPGDQPFTWICPNTSIANIFPDCSWALKLAGQDGKELRLTARNPTVWADPVAPLTYGGFKTWNLEMIPQSWENWKRKRLPVTYAADGTVTLKATLAKGKRSWTVGSGAPLVGDRLDRVKDMVLDWPADPAQPHPRLFVDQAELDALRKRAAEDAELLKTISHNEDAAGILSLLAKPADKRTKAEIDAALKPLRDFLALLGNFDVMRSAVRTAAMYDAAIDSGLLTAEERTLMRAQMAYLGYQMADPQTWDMERGYHSGNPNMSISYTCSLGVIAALLRDHPMAKTWAERATQWEDKWLSDDVGPNGEWLPEGSHYGVVSLEPLVTYAVAAQRAGFHDFTNDPRLKKFLLYYAKTQTPRDPQRGNLRATGAWGRGTSGDKHAVFGVAARMTAKSDPAFSQVMQWTWKELGCPTFMGDGRLGGFEPYYQDRRLPAQAPAWSSDLFPNLGVFFRSAFNTPNESYLILLSHTDYLRNLDVWTPGIGGFSQWFGRGKPLSTCFNVDTGYSARHELLRDGVRLARNWGAPGDPKAPFGLLVKTEPQAVALFPLPLREGVGGGGADYVRARFTSTKADDRDWFPTLAPPAFPRVVPAKEPKLDWTRQVLFLKDTEPAGPAYIVVHDTTSGGQPTAWQFWTLSEKIGAPEQTKDLAAFLADKPGAKLLPARELPAGNRYTAIGQFEMDVEFFVASPAGTPRHTLRYGGPDNSRVPEYEDLLHLQQPGDGAYYVAIFPRPRQEQSPEFTALADGKIIKAAGAFGSDYALLAPDAATATAEDVRMAGTAAAVQVRPTGTTLTLGAAGQVQWKTFGLEAPQAATLLAAGDTLTLSLPADSPGGTLAIIAPAGWSLKEPVNGVTCEAQAGKYALTLAAGVARV
ncbi:MAG: hypothetical protein ABSE73_19655, partial [Planctomycetota bacterium]